MKRKILRFFFGMGGTLPYSSRKESLQMSVYLFRGRREFWVGRRLEKWW